MAHSIVEIGLLIVLIMILIGISAAGIRFCRYWSSNSLKRFEGVKISDAYPLIKSGDIILFIASTHDFTNSIFTILIFSHVGIVVKRRGPDGIPKLYISESSAITHIMPDPKHPEIEYMSSSGSTMVPLLTRLKHYTGETFLMSLSAPLDLKREEKLTKAAENSIGYPYPNALQGLAGILSIRTSSRLCHEHVAFILDESDLTPLNSGGLYNAGFLGSARAVANLHEKTLPDNYYYHQPKKILYDISAPLTRTFDEIDV